MVLVAALVVVGLSHYTVRNLGINTDTADMLSEQLPWRRTYLTYKQAFPQYVKTLVVVIDGATPDLADEAKERLAAALASEGDVFRSVYVPGGGDFFKRHGLMYLDIPELEELTDNLARIQPFLGKLVQDQSLAGVLSMIEEAMEAVLDGEEFDLAPVMDRVGDAVGARIDDRFYQLSWQELMLGRSSTPDERRRLIVLQPMLDFSGLLPGELAIRTVRRLLNELRLDEGNGARVRLTGPVALENEELKSASQGAGLAAGLTLVMVGLILFLALRSVRLVIACLLTLVAGLIGTAAFAAWAVGHLNLISVAFAVLYIGLGIDYAIHLCLRYRELRIQGRHHAAALSEAASDVGSSLVVCAVSTAAGFYAFVPTAYSGVSELGLISGTGMFVSLFASLTLLPALITLMPLSPEKLRGEARRPSTAARLLSWPQRHPRFLWIGVLAMGAASLALVRSVSFDFNPMNLRDPHTESVRTFHELLSESKNSPLTISVLETEARSAQASASRLKRLDLVDKVVTLRDFVPKDQEDKLGIIDEMAMVLGPELDLPAGSRDSDLAGRLYALGELGSRLERFIGEAEPEQAAAGTRLLAKLRRFRAYLHARSPSQQEAVLGELERSIVAALPDRLETLRASLKADSVSLDDLPPELVERWVSGDGQHRIEVFPRENLANNAALERFAQQVRSVEPNATGSPVISVEAGAAVVQAFREAFLYALIFICLLLLTMLRSPRDAALVLVPLLLASVFTGAGSVVLDIPFNFANIIALPLLMGIGVDNGIHMVHRSRTALPADGNLLATSTTRGVIYSSLTTLASFGNLAFSRHLGMASMGQLLALGIALTLVCTLVVLPTLLPSNLSEPGSS